MAKFTRRTVSGENPTSATVSICSRMPASETRIGTENGARIASETCMDQGQGAERGCAAHNEGEAVGM